MQLLHSTTFEIGLVCFVLGSIMPLVAGRNKRLGNALANGALLLGGMMFFAAAVIVLLTGKEYSLYAWRIVENIDLVFCLDTLSAYFLLVIGMVSVAAAFYSFGYAEKCYVKEQPGRLGALVNLFALSLVGVVCVQNAVTFMIFWEFMALTSFFLVMFDHEKDKVRPGGYMYIAVTHIGSVFLTIAFLLLFCYTGSMEFSAYREMGPRLPEGVRSIILVLVMVGFGAKMGLFPLQVWLPRAYPVAPVSTAAFMSSAMIKTAVYAFIRVVFEFLGTGPAWWGICVMAVGMMTAVFCVLLAVIQNDMKRFLSYSSAENLGVIFVGIGAALFFRAEELELLAAFALSAALFHVYVHAVFKALLFMVAGAVETETGTVNINALGGLIHKMPQTAAFMLIGGLSLASLPPLSGFMSEWLLLQSLAQMIFAAGGAWVRLFGVMAVLCVVFSGALCAAAVVKQFGTAFLAKARTKSVEKAKEVCVSMRIGMGILAVLSLAGGLFPGSVMRLIHAVSGRYFNALPNSGNLTLFPPGTHESHSLVIAVFLMLGIVLLGAVYLCLRYKYGPSKVILEETWNCGTMLAPSMSYTGTGYSHPVLLIFKRLIGLNREVKVEQEYAYYPKRIGHRMDISARIADNVYKPLVGMMVQFFKRIRKIQSGNLQAYLSYMIAALIVALLWIGRG